MQSLATIGRLLVVTTGLALTGTALADDKAGAITIALPNEPANIDACNITVTGIGIITKENIAETLTTLDPDDSTVLPRLATGWTDQGEGTWRVTLREGVKFHDGTDFNSASVVKAIDRLQRPDLTCLDRTKIKGVTFTTTSVDDHTVDIKAEPAQVLMPIFLSFIAVPAVSTSDTALSRAPVGTGPYKFVSWNAGEGVVAERFDGYWGDKPEVEKVNYIFRSESALRASMVDIGEADLAADLAPQDATSPDKDFSFFSGETTRIRMVMQPPLDDIRVRQALNLAFDREALIGTVFSADVLAATQFIPPKINGSNPDLKVWPYDPDQAKALLDAARADGAPVDKEIRLIGRIGFYPNENEALQAMQQMWSSVGFNIKLEMMESAEWLKLVNRPYAENRSAMMIAEQHDNNNGDAAFTMPFRYRTDGQQSETSIPALDDLLDRASISTGEERTKLYQEANRLIAQDVVPDVPMFHMVSFLRVSPRVVYKPTSLSALQLEVAQITFAKP